ncbi:MAG: IS630 family transposase [Deltaproteobacteria bacterium]|nr:MAG: IS630 family transposase [Deltaproteobacteria bacterium]
MRRALPSEPRLAPAQAARVELPAADGPRAGARRGGDPPLEARAVAGTKKNAAAQGQTIVFVDESGLTERPHRCRTWAPRGQTPVLQYHFNWNLLSAIAGITWWSFYFRLFPGPIKGPQIVEFLTHLQRHLRGKLLVIWDGLPAHRSRVVRDYVAARRRRITLEYLPGYAPELNPVEYVWGYWKHHELPNLCPKTFGQLSQHARAALRRMRRRPTLVAAFWQQAELFA